MAATFPRYLNYILISEWENMRTHKRGDDYDVYKEKFAQKLLDVLYDKVSASLAKLYFSA